MDYMNYCYFLQAIEEDRRDQAYCEMMIDQQERPEEPEDDQNEGQESQYDEF